MFQASSFELICRVSHPFLLQTDIRQKKVSCDRSLTLEKVKLRLSLESAGIAEIEQTTVIQLFRNHGKNVTIQNLSNAKTVRFIIKRTL